MNNEFHVNIVLISSARGTYEHLEVSFCVEASGHGAVGPGGRVISNPENHHFCGFDQGGGGLSRFEVHFAS